MIHMAEVDGEPSQDEGAGECAIRVIVSLRQRLARIHHLATIEGSQTQNPYTGNLDEVACLSTQEA